MTDAQGWGRGEAELADLYPSRRPGGPAILERKEPVLHGAPRAGSGALTERQRYAFERDGFLTFQRLLPPEPLAELQRDALRLRQQAEAGRGGPETVRESCSGEVRSIFAVHQLSPVVLRVARDERVLAIAEEILSGPVYLHQARVNYKPGLRGREFYWHSDFETWHVEDGMPGMRAVSLSLALTDNHEFNGPVMVIPGSHRWFVSCAGTTPERHYEQSLRQQRLGVPDDGILHELVRRGGIQAPKGHAGFALWFDCNVMHGSNGNITPFPRSNLFLVFNSVENRLRAPFSGHPPRPEHIAHRRDVAPLAPAA